MRNCHIDEFYAWRTQKDAKVRSGHAEREGKVYSVHAPPPDGPPGTAPNCRCWKESPTLREIRSGDVPCHYNKLKIEENAVRDRLAALQNEASGIMIEKSLLEDEIEALEEALATIGDPDFPIHVPSLPKSWPEFVLNLVSLAFDAFRAGNYFAVQKAKADLQKLIATRKSRLRAITPRVEAVKKQMDALQWS